MSARLRVYHTLEELEGIRPAWAATPIGRHDADPDFYLAFAGSRDRFVRPYVVVVEEDGEPRAMLVARVEDIGLPARVGYRTVAEPHVRAITVVHGGVAGITRAYAPLVLAELRRALARREADVVRLPSMPLDAPLRELAQTRTPAFRRQPAVKRSVHRALALPDTMEAFMASRSKSTRDGIKRYRRKLERELGDRMELRIHDKPEDLERIFADCEPVAARTYQRGLGVALADTPAQRALLEVGLRRGWYRVYVIALDGRAVAFWPGYAHRGTFHIGTPGYDPELAEFRIGTYLQMRMLEHLIADPAVHRVDFGFGDAEYKRRFASESWEEAELSLFAARPRPLAVNALRSSIDLAARAAAEGLERAGLRERLKKTWRRRLVERTA